MASGASDPAAAAAEDPAKASGTPAGPAGEASAPAEPAAPLQPIIIKKIIDEGHAGGHGVAWKIALADMMTAMMA